MLPHGSNPGYGGGLALINTNNISIIHHQSENKAHFRKYTKNGYVKGSDVSNSNCGHCNGFTYSPSTGYLYATAYKKGQASGKIIVLNTNFKQLYTVTLPVAVCSIACDPITGQFYACRGSNLYVFGSNALNKGASGQKYKRYSSGGGTNQDTGGYNGVIYQVMYHESYGVINCFNASNGKKVGDIKIQYSETESCAVDGNGNLVYLTANGQRALNWTNIPVASKFKGSAASGLKTSKGSIPKSGSKGMTAPEAFVSVAKAELGYKETGDNNTKYGKWYGMNNQPWCAIFISWCCNKALGSNKAIPKNALAFDVAQGAVDAGGKWIKKASKGPTTHVGLIASVKNGTATTVEGNHGDKVGSRTISVPSGTRKGDLIVFYRSSVGGIARPNWPGGKYGYVDDVYGEVYGDPVLEVHPEQLYSSNNYKYVENNKEETEEQKRLKSYQQSLKDFLANINVSVTDPVVPDIQLPNITGSSNVKKPQTKFEGDISGSALPATVNYVEAPYAKITLGGVSIGTYKEGSYPNYVTGLSVKKTNGSLNEYTINLVHQVAAGDNPNYIDNLISANGYNKIQIEYGDAQAGIAYRDINALLIDVKSKFDFFNNCISYTLSATSSSAMSAVNKRNYASVTDKPSNIITNMLYETGELLDYFPAMKSRDFVNSNNLIPSDDIKVAIDAVTNTTPLNYMNKLVSSMKSNSGDYIYYLNINDEDNLGSYFNIQQVKTKMTTSMFPLVYEVDINYPDENSLIYNFSVNTDYTWPLAYEYGGSFPSYDYNILNNGNLIARELKGNMKSTRVTDNIFLTDKNWWTNVTEFPITATLETKGLTSYLLLLNYIKVNVFYFGNKRDSSGIYIVTGQEDSLSGNGFRTKLDLLRVAGDGQYLTVDGRVVS